MHHVMNRGLAKRTVFLGRPEIRYFKSRLAREARRGEVEVHAFCFMTTHFHLLVGSPRGHLSHAMRRTENAFVRWFNRRHRRDGPLFRGRFTSRCIDTESYLRTVVRYIDQNPVSAGIVDAPGDYPHGSAWTRGRGAAPRWLSGLPEAEGTAGEPNAHESWIVERRLEKATAPDPLDDLVGASPQRVQRWMESKARVADGSSGPSCVLSPRALRAAIAWARVRHGAWRVSPGARTKDGWLLLELGMSRDLVGLSTTEASLALGIARSSGGHAVTEHRRLLLVDPRYGERAAEVLEHGLRIVFGPTRSVETIEPGSIVGEIEPGSVFSSHVRGPRATVDRDVRSVARHGAERESSGADR